MKMPSVATPSEVTLANALKDTTVPVELVLKDGVTMLYAPRIKNVSLPPQSIASARVALSLMKTMFALMSTNVMPSTPVKKTQPASTYQGVTSVLAMRVSTEVAQFASKALAVMKTVRRTRSVFHLQLLLVSVKMALFVMKNKLALTLMSAQKLQAWCQIVMKMQVAQNLKKSPFPEPMGAQE